MKSLLAGSSRFVQAAFVAFVLSRLYLYAFFSASSSDVTIYFRYALAGVDHGLTAYREIEIEYPPVAYWMICLPRQTMSDRFSEAKVPPKEYLTALQSYDRRFRAFMLGLDLAAFAFFAAIVRRRKPERLAACLWAYLACTHLLGYVLFERLDVGLNLCLLGWMYGALRGDDGDRRGRYWAILGDGLLGLGVSYKLIPIVVVPFALLLQAARLRKNRRDLSPLVGATAMFVTAVGPFAYYYAIVGDHLGRMFAYHSQRGIEIESTYATWMMLTEAPAKLTPYFDFGSWNLGGAAEAMLMRLSTPLLVAALCVLGVRAVVQVVRGRYDGRSAYLGASAAIVVAVFFAKVLSIQYMCWTLPLVVLATMESLRRRLFAVVVGACVASAALSSFVYPYHFLDDIFAYPYSEESPPPWTLVGQQQRTERNGRSVVVGTLSEYGPPWWAMTVRNLLFTGCTALVVVGSLRKPSVAADGE